MFGRTRVSIELGLDETTAHTIHQDSPDVADVPDVVEVGDAMGSAVAVADFNHDGNLDGLTGLPGEDTTPTVPTSARPCSCPEPAPATA